MERDNAKRVVVEIPGELHTVRCKMTKKTLAEAMRERVASIPNEPHIIVKALAGTGKSSTLIEGLKLMHGIQPRFTPSAQQQAVWNEMMKSAGKGYRCGMVAFNRSIADELKQRVPLGVEAMTMHSLGLRTVTKCLGRLRVEQYRTQDLIAGLLHQDIRTLRKEQGVVINAVEELVALCKVNLTKPDPVDIEHGWPLKLQQLADYYQVELDSESGRSYRVEVFDLVPRVLELAANPQKDGCIDYNDMVWLPVALGLAPTKYDMLLVDELQDLSRCQQELALAAADRFVGVGDENQACYGFAGADCEAMQRLGERLKCTVRGCVELPLTVTRRCGKAIVKEAQKTVPTFEAFEGNPEGIMCTLPYGKEGEPGKGTYHEAAKEGDMVICRVNAPLVGQCFRFLRMGIRANIMGRNIGKGLITLMKKLKATDVRDLVGKVSDWIHQEQGKEQSKRNPSEAQIIAISDKGMCLVAFTEGANNLVDVEDKINKMFTDDPDRPGIRMSSIHKAKGLEARRVFFLMPKGGGCPHPMARSGWQLKQDYNLLYIGITRAIEELVFVVESQTGVPRAERSRV